MKLPSPLGRRDLRDAALAVAIVALVALSWLLVVEGGPGNPGPVLKNYLYLLGYSYLILFLPQLGGGGRMGTALSIGGGIGVAILLMVDLTALRFFGSPFLQLYSFLPMSASNASWKALAGYAASYLSPGVCLLAVATIFIGLGLARLPHNRNRARAALLLLLPQFLLGTWLATPAPDRSDPRIAALMDEPQRPLRRLAGADRSGSFAIARPPRAEPRTVIVVIMESTGASTPASDGKRLLSQSIVADSGTDRWIDFPNAVTNSNATDISVPSMLTGAGAHEPAAKLHALPFLSDYAAARGYRTWFITSSSMKWGGFEGFFANAPIDKVLTGDTSGQPFLSDVSVDDEFVYRNAANAIATSDGKLFLTLYPQALHWPFQTRSAFAIPAAIKDKRARAAYVAEAGFRLLFETLKRTDRLDDALIVIAGDHGEFDYSTTLRMPRMRMNSFEEGILSPIFLIKAPARLPAPDTATLAANSGKLVANLDIAPTIADLLGGELKPGLSYAGKSLLRPVPNDRVAYSTSTNEWRHWPQATIAVSRADERMTCEKARLCRLSTAQGPALTFSRQAGPDDMLFQFAAGNPILRQALGQIYRDHYR